MTPLRFKVASKTEMASTPGFKHVQFGASRQDAFGEATPNVNFAAMMTDAVADQFEVGKEYDFAPTLVATEPAA